VGRIIRDGLEVCAPYEPLLLRTRAYCNACWQSQRPVPIRTVDSTTCWRRSEGDLGALADGRSSTMRPAYQVISGGSTTARLLQRPIESLASRSKCELPLVLSVSNLDARRHGRRIGIATSVYEGLAVSRLLRARWSRRWSGWNDGGQCSECQRRGSANVQRDNRRELNMRLFVGQCQQCRQCDAHDPRHPEPHISEIWLLSLRELSVFE